MFVCVTHFQNECKILIFSYRNKNRYTAVKKEYVFNTTRTSNFISVCNEDSTWTPVDTLVSKLIFVQVDKFYFIGFFFISGIACDSPLDPPAWTGLLLKPFINIKFGGTAIYRCPPNSRFETDPQQYRLPVLCHDDGMNGTYTYVDPSTNMDTGTPFDHATWTWPKCVTSKCLIATKSNIYLPIISQGWLPAAAIILELRNV